MNGKIEAAMVREKPDLMPWARYILDELRKEEGDEPERVREHGRGERAVPIVQSLYA